MKAFLFSAGLGTRFKPWTDHHPKALAMVNGKSLLQRNIEYLQQYGIYNVIVNVHHFADQVINAIDENNGWGSNVEISDERNELLETGGALLHAKHLLNNERFISLNVDILTDLDISKLINYHQQQNALVSFGITNRETSRNFLFDQDLRLSGWKNRNTGEEIISRKVDGLIERAYSCVAVFEPPFISMIKQEGKFSLTVPYLDLCADNQIMGYDHSGDRFIDVGKPESVAIAEKLFS